MFCVGGSAVPNALRRVACILSALFALALELGCCDVWCWVKTRVATLVLGCLFVALRCTFALEQVFCSFCCGVQTREVNPSAGMHILVLCRRPLALEHKFFYV